MPTTLRPFTPEQARDAAHKSWVVRRARQAEAEKHKLISAEIAEHPAEHMPDRYAVANLKRVRKQLSCLFDDLDGAIEGTTVEQDSKGRLQVINPAGIDRLCAAISRVSELERQWAGRSLPPTLRANDKASRSRRPGSKPTTPSV